MKVKKKIKNNVYLLVSVFYKISVDMLYVFGTSIVYSYLGRELRFNIEKYCIGWIVFWTFIYCIEKIEVVRIRFMIKCIFMLCGVSNISVYGLRDYDNSSFLIVLLFWILMFGICISLPHIKQYNDVNRNRKEQQITFNNKDDLLLILGALITVVEIARYGLNVLEYADIYSARYSFREQKLSAIENYLLSWNGTVILPWCFLVSSIRNKYFKSGISLIFAIFAFLISGLKTWIVIYIIIIGFFLLMKKERDFDYSLNIVITGISGIILGSIFIFYRTGNYGLLGILDRILILPGEINYYYIDFFRRNEFLYLRESIFKVFASSPYTPWSAVQISQKYMSAAYYHNATNGLVGDIYGNFGLVGIIVYPIIIVISFIILNFALDGFDEIVSSVVIFILMWLLINTSYFTWLMTGGFFIYVIILLFYKKYRIKKIN